MSISPSRKLKNKILIIVKGLNILKHEALLGYDKLQQHLSNNDDDCFPGSFAFNGSCIYFSTREQRLSWQEANQFCQSLPLNTSFLTIETASEFEFVRKTIVRLKVKEEPVDQLVFLIGFSLVKNRWRWISNKSLEIDQNVLKLDESAYEYLKNPLGSCGSLALTRNYDLILKSAPCETLKTRFICKYSKIFGVLSFTYYLRLFPYNISHNCLMFTCRTIIERYSLCS